MSQLIPRAASTLVERALRRTPVVALIGARQCGKTTLARQFVAAGSPNYFDLEDPLSLARLDEPVTALGPLTGLVVVDEVQRRPNLFPVLRVLADRDENPARFLVLGSAGPTSSARARNRWPAASSTSNSPGSRFPNSGPRGCPICGCAAGFRGRCSRRATRTA